MNTIERPADMNDATWKLLLQAREMAKRTGVTFDKAYDILWKGRQPRGTAITQGKIAEIGFMAEVERTMTEKKISRAAAIRRVVKENPQLHEAWLSSLKPVSAERSKNVPTS